MSEESVADNLKALGDQMADLLRAAWDRPERKNLQREIETGLSDLGDALSRATTDFRESETGQRMQSDAAQVRTQIEESGWEENVRTEVNAAVSTLREKLEELTDKLNQTGKDGVDDGTG